MSEKSGNHRLDSIPLPPTIVEALSHVERRECVSHSVKLTGDDSEHEQQGGTAEFKLTSDNHAFYVGKLIPNTTSEKIRRLLGWGAVPERIYNTDFLTGALEYLFANLQKGQKARVGVCPSLSELLNGPEDVEHALTAEREMTLIRQIAKKKFGKSEDSLEVVTLEQQPQHKDLFKALRDSVDSETGRANIEKALADNEDEQSVKVATDSLQIAKRLFRAAKDSEELTDVLRKTMPAKLKENAEESPATQYYSLIEVAIRLSDMLNGTHIQGGSERQAIYNGIIIQLIKGEEGRYKDIEELKPLFEMLKGLRFETLHLNNAKNYHHLKKVQRTARSRLLIYATLFAALVSGSVGIGMFVERRRAREAEERIYEEIVRQRLRHQKFVVDGKFKIPNKYNPEVLRDIVENASQQLKKRYKLTDGIIAELQPHLISYFLRNGEYISNIHVSPDGQRVVSKEREFAVGNRQFLPTIKGNGFELNDSVDMFVEENAPYFLSREIEIQRPFKDLYKYIPAFKRLVESDENIGTDTAYEVPKFAMGTQQHKAQKIGLFYSGAAYDNEFEFYTLKFGNGEQYIVAKDPDGLQTNGIVTSSMAKLGAAQFLYGVRRHDFLSMKRYGNDIYSFGSPHDVYRDEYKQLCKIQLENDKFIRDLYEPIIYHDTLGEFPDCEVIVYFSYDAKTNLPINCVLGRFNGEKSFTYESGRRFARWYYDQQDQWLDYHYNKPKALKLPK